jgi:hypothetical protein
MERPLLNPPPAVPVAPITRRKTRRAGKLGAGWMHAQMLRRIAEKNLQAQHNRGVKHLRADHGAYTEVGASDQLVLQSPFPARMARRKWLAGISAQRGY